MKKRLLLMSFVSGALLYAQREISNLEKQFSKLTESLKASSPRATQPTVQPSQAVELTANDYVKYLDEQILKLQRANFSADDIRMLEQIRDHIKRTGKAPTEEAIPVAPSVPEAPPAPEITEVPAPAPVVIKKKDVPGKPQPTPVARPTQPQQPAGLLEAIRKGTKLKKVEATAGAKKPETGVDTRLAEALKKPKETGLAQPKPQTTPTVIGSLSPELQRRLQQRRQALGEPEAESETWETE